MLIRARLAGRPIEMHEIRPERQQRSRLGFAGVHVS